MVDQLKISKQFSGSTLPIKKFENLGKKKDKCRSITKMMMQCGGGNIF
jgi:hypothetical protein